jgi:mercuric ion transport protein
MLSLTRSVWSMDISALNARGSLLAAILGAIGVSVCCVGPLVVLALGFGGAWVGNLTALETYRPLFIALTLLFFGLAFRRLYLAPQVCGTGIACADPLTIRRQRIVFWVVSALMLGLLAVPWLGPLFHRSGVRSRNSGKRYI